jgi:hypothetical protein
VTTWLQTAMSLLTKPPSDEDFYPNDRLPSEQVIGDFPLRGYTGPTVLVAKSRYFSAKNVGGFIDRHVAEMVERRYPVSKQYVEADILALEQLAENCDAVRVRPAR